MARDGAGGWPLPPQEQGWHRRCGAEDTHALPGQDCLTDPGVILEVLRRPMHSRNGRIKPRGQRLTCAEVLATTGRSRVALADRAGAMSLAVGCESWGGRGICRGGGFSANNPLSGRLFRSARRDRNRGAFSVCSRHSPCPAPAPSLIRGHEIIVPWRCRGPVGPGGGD